MNKHALKAENNSKIGKKRILRRLAVLFLVLVVAVGGIWLYGIMEEKHLVTTFYSLHSDRVEEPFRIVQLSDLHKNEFGERNADLVERVRSLKPDIIAITGDMNIHGDNDYEVVLALCRDLLPIAPVYYVMGNHEFVDFANARNNIRQDLIDTGIYLLENEYAVVNVNNNRVLIGGLVDEPDNYTDRGKLFVETFCGDDGFHLLLTHYPGFFLNRLEDNSIELALCGHAHGGTVRIPGLGGLYSHEEGWLPSLYEGMHRLGHTTVVVSRGLGNEYFVPRINNPPELVVIDVDHE